MRVLKNPVVLNYVQAIDNIQRYQQRVEGGFVGTPPASIEPAPPAVAPPPQEENSAALTLAIQQLNQILSSGRIYAIIDDDSAIDLRDRINQLVAASGGVL